MQSSAKNVERLECSTDGMLEKIYEPTNNSWANFRPTVTKPPSACSHKGRKMPYTVWSTSSSMPSCADVSLVCRKLVTSVTVGTVPTKAWERSARLEHLPCLERVCPELQGLTSLSIRLR